MSEIIIFVGVLLLAAIFAIINPIKEKKRNEGYSDGEPNFISSDGNNDISSNCSGDFGGDCGGDGGGGD
ncbi:MAG: hypothetical protein J0L55_12225 [Caulobacterales bacterium]|nr:hypothetical protein [Caulobacterales bacterium]MCA0373053.1 hypothetical protein [Pseudomonadota bacterium]